MCDNDNSVMSSLKQSQENMLSLISDLQVATNRILHNVKKIPPEKATTTDLMVAYCGIIMSNIISILFLGNNPITVENVSDKILEAAIKLGILEKSSNEIVSLSFEQVSKLYRDIINYKHQFN